MPATKCEEGDRTSQLELSDGALDKPRRLGCGMALQVLSTKPSPRKSEAEEREQNGYRTARRMRKAVPAVAPAGKRAPNKAHGTAGREPAGLSRPMTFRS